MNVHLSIYLSFYLSEIDIKYTTHIDSICVYIYINKSTIHVCIYICTHNHVLHTYIQIYSSWYNVKLCSNSLLNGDKKAQRMIGFPHFLTLWVKVPEPPWCEASARPLCSPALPSQSRGIVTAFSKRNRRDKHTQGTPIPGDQGFTSIRDSQGVCVCEKHKETHGNDLQMVDSPCTVGALRRPPHDRKVGL